MWTAASEFDSRPLLPPQEVEMGCDIHPLMFVNRGDSKLQSWQFVAVPPSNRNYAFFGALAGVRDEHVPVVKEPAGFPRWFKDREFDVFRHSEWPMPGVSMEHTPSWVSLADMHKHLAKLDGVVGTDTLGAWHQWIELMEYYRDAYGITHNEGVVIVFDFDS